MGLGITRRAQTAATIITGICAFFLITVTADAGAGPPPSYLDIEDACVVSNVVDSGTVPAEWLVVTMYDVSWSGTTNYPSSPINDNIVIQFMDDVGTSVYAMTTAYPYYNNGYDKGVAAFYFNPVEVSAYNLSWEHQYRIRISTMPGTFTSAKSGNYIIPSSDYCTDGPNSVAANRSFLGDYLLEVAHLLEVNWGFTAGLTTISVDEVLSEYGEEYYLRAIDPNLRSMCPDIFLASDNIPPFTERVWSGSHATELETQFDDGTPTLINNFYDSLGQNKSLVLNGMTVMIVIALMVISGIVLGDLLPGLLGGCTYVLMVSVDLGWFHIAIYSIILFLFVVYAANKTLRVNQA